MFRRYVAHLSYALIFVLVLFVINRIMSNFNLSIYVTIAVLCIYCPDCSENSRAVAATLASALTILFG